jgi:hypothetical protein
METKFPLPTRKLARLSGWHLRIICGRCGRPSVIGIDEIGSPKSAVWEVLLRLRCSGDRYGRRCKGTPSKAWLVDGLDTAKTPRSVREIAVM